MIEIPLTAIRRPRKKKPALRERPSLDRDLQVAMALCLRDMMDGIIGKSRARRRTMNAG